MKRIFILTITILLVLAIFIYIWNNKVKPLPDNRMLIANTKSTESATSTADLIKVDFPLPNDRVRSPLNISGQARGQWFFEAVFPVILTDVNGHILAEEQGRGPGDRWMTTNFVPFEAGLVFDRQTPGSHGFLILKRANPSDMPQNDRSLKIPVTF